MKKYPCCQINRLDLVTHVEFTKWALREIINHRLATWHKPHLTELGVYSDMFVWKGHDYNGSNDDMPEDVWRSLCKEVGLGFEGLIWITFL